MSQDNRIYYVVSIFSDLTLISFKLNIVYLDFDENLDRYILVLSIDTLDKQMKKLIVPYLTQ